MEDLHDSLYGTLNDTLNATNATDASPFPTLTPSLPACIGLSAIGGLLEVTSTMCLAFPEYKAKLGKPYSACTQRLLLLANLLLMGVASLLYIAGSWFGPVSISVPTVMVSKLLSNLVIMGMVLRMAEFPKEQQVGTFCIACAAAAAAVANTHRSSSTPAPQHSPTALLIPCRCAILTLPDVGPKDQPGQDATQLLLAPVAVGWGALLMAATLACCVGMAAGSGRGALRLYVLSRSLI